MLKLCECDEINGGKGGIVRFNPPPPPSDYPLNLHLFDTFFYAENLGNFTTREGGELRKNHHISPLKYLCSPLKISNLRNNRRT